VVLERGIPVQIMGCKDTLLGSTGLPERDRI
jgi:hypothetical protein